MTRLQMPIIPGDEVHFMFNDQIESAIIEEVTTRTSFNSFMALRTTFTYTIKDNPAGPQYRTMGFTANELFLSKQELLDNL